MGSPNSQSKKISVDTFLRFSPSQKILYKDNIGKGRKLFLGGGRGAGRSTFLWQSVTLACLQYAGIRASIIRTNMPEVKKNFIRPFRRAVPQELYTFNVNDALATFYNGSTIDFIGLAAPDDYTKIKGVEFELMGIDEINELDSELIERIRGSNRGNSNPNFLPTLICTGNPGGRSDDYVKKFWVQPNYAKWTEEQLLHKDEYAYVFQTVKDNPDQEFARNYIAELETKPEFLRRQWLYGDWSIAEGAFFEEWDARYHVVKDFPIPDHWPKYRGIDHGRGAHPSVCLWLAQNPDTEESYVYREVATTQPTEEFIRLVDSYSPHEEQIVMTIADTSMFHSTNETYTSESPAFMFSRAGIPLTRAVKDRTNGWRILKQWMHWQETDKTAIDESGRIVPVINMPKLRFFKTCEKTIETIPKMRYTRTTTTASRYGDLDSDMEDDWVDALRYIVVSAFGYPVMPMGESDYENSPQDSYEREEYNREESFGTRKGSWALFR